ncbi:hypothetical protein [Dethiothermospora halolimnae]|uniref:hypothetical protein n=1 Tax=Dethiothermospora halolimnae TaxID=3114390 RepID=UPI003CCC163F
MQMTMNYEEIEPICHTFGEEKKIVIGSMIIRNVKHLAIELNTCGESTIKKICFLDREGKEIANTVIKWMHELEIKTDDAGFVKIKEHDMLDSFRKVRISAN